MTTHDILLDRFVGGIHRVAKKNNYNGCGARGRLEKTPTGYMLKSMYAVNPDVPFTSDDVQHWGQFQDDDNANCVRIQLW